jgi:hypothetical protein
MYRLMLFDGLLVDQVGTFGVVVAQNEFEDGGYARSRIGQDRVGVKVGAKPTLHLPGG